MIRRYVVQAIGLRLGRTKASVDSKRRQVLRLRELGVRGTARLARLLVVPENFAQRRSLAAIEQHARSRGEGVKRFIRRANGRWRAHLVGPYVRRKQGT